MTTPAKRPAIKRPPVLFDRTQKLHQAIQKRTGRTFLAYWNSHSGSVCHSDVLGLWTVLRRTKGTGPATLFIKSDGGTGSASLRIVNLLREHVSHLVAAVPLECASAATMMALGADEIHMGPLAYLTAIDTSIRHDLSPLDRDNERVSVSQDELGRVVKLWRDHGSEGERKPYEALFPYVHPLVIGAVDRASSLSIQLCTEILGYHMKDAKKAQRISAHLNSAYPSHSYPITLREAERIGLHANPLDAELNTMLLELNSIYSEMGQRAVTDFDERNHHDNEIINIIEGPGVMVYFQVDKDWHYRVEERRWVSLNEKSGWRIAERRSGKMTTEVLHAR